MHKDGIQPRPRHQITKKRHFKEAKNSDIERAFTHPALTDGNYQSTQFNPQLAEDKVCYFPLCSGKRGLNTDEEMLQQS